MTKASTDLADALLEQHVKHELSSLKGAKLRRFLAQEVDELFGYASDVTLGRITSAEQVMGLIKRVVINMELDPGIPELAADMATEVLNAPIQKTTKLSQMITREQATGFLEEALELKQQRERVISEIMSHPVYQELVSNLVYQGVVNYLYEDNVLTKSVPGVGSMMKFGKRMANRAVPGLDESFERRFKSWLSDSLPGLISRSEQFLNKSLTDDELRDSEWRSGSRWKTTPLRNCTKAWAISSYRNSSFWGMNSGCSSAKRLISKAASMRWSPTCLNSTATGPFSTC